MASTKKHKLNFRFHDPNLPEETADFLLKLFIEVNKPKAEAAIRAAAEKEAEKMSALAMTRCQSLAWSAAGSHYETMKA